MANPRYSQNRKGLGFVAPKEEMPVTSGGAIPLGPQRDASYQPQAEEAPEEDFGTPEDAAPEMGDGWTDDEREFMEEVEAGTESGDLYEGVDAWQKKWLKRAQEMGLDYEAAMRVLDSIADLDPPESGYGGGYDEE
jgi:hypothetical protein